MALSRRSFLKRAAGTVGALAVAPLVTQGEGTPVPAPPAVTQWQDTALAPDDPYRPGHVVRPSEFFAAMDREHERILREAAIENARLVQSLVQHSLLSRESAMAMLFKEA